MTFIPIITHRGRRTAPTKGFGVHIINHKRLDIAIGPALAEELGWWPGERVSVSLGFGEDARKIRVSRSKSTCAGHKLTLKSSRWMKASITIPAVHYGYTRDQIISTFRDALKDAKRIAADGALIIAVPKPRVRVAAVMEAV